MNGSRMAAVLAAAVLAAGCGGGETSLDTRTPVRLTPQQRYAVLAEMRTMLASESGILAAAPRGDSAAIRDAALKSGTGAAADPALDKLLPTEWLQIAVQTHRGFDDLAAYAGGGQDEVVRRLGGITATCVSCHAMYRLSSR